MRIGLRTLAFAGLLGTLLIGLATPSAEACGHKKKMKRHGRHQMEMHEPCPPPPCGGEMAHGGPAHHGNMGYGAPAMYAPPSYGGMMGNPQAMPSMQGGMMQGGMMQGGMMHDGMMAPPAPGGMGARFVRMLRR